MFYLHHSSKNFIDRPHLQTIWVSKVLIHAVREKASTSDARTQLTKHKIHSTNDRNSVSKQVALGNVVKATQVSETRGANVASIGALATVTDNVDAHLALGGLNDRVRLAGGHGVTLCVEKEVVNEGLHVLLHGGARRGSDLVVLDADGAGGHLVEALVDDAQRLAELFHAAEIAVVAVAVGADGDVEFDLVIGIVGLALADIPRDTGTAQHDTSEGQVQSLGGRHNTDATQTLDPDSVVSKHLLSLVDSVAELRGPLVDVVEKANGQVLVDTAGADVGGVQASTGDTLIEFLSIGHQLAAPWRF